MRTFGNILWVVLCGVRLDIEYVVAGLLMIFPIVTIPLAVQSFKLAGYALWPFGRAVVDKPDSNAAMSGIGNVIWLILAGCWLALSHLFVGLLFCITIIGIPFGVANFKLAGLSIWPFGKTIVHASLAGKDALVVVPLGGASTAWQHQCSVHDPRPTAGRPSKWALQDVSISNTASVDSTGHTAVGRNRWLCSMMHFRMAK